MFATVNELSGLPGLPGTLPGIRNAMKKRACGSPELVRKRTGSKAFEYHVDLLPAEARELLKLQHRRKAVAASDGSVMAPSAGKGVKSSSTLSALEVYRSHPAVADRKVQELSCKQKQVADARMVLVYEVLNLMNTGSTRKDAVEFIASESKVGNLPAILQEAAEQANARRGTTRAGVGKSSLHKWLTDYLATSNSTERLALMAPGVNKPRRPEDILWFAHFLPYWRDPRGYSLKECYRSFSDDWERNYADQEAMLAALPSYDALRRAMEKLNMHEKQRGRVTGGAWKALQPFIRRDWSVLKANDVWIGDGHGMKMTIRHPEHGQRFKPELTMIIDGVTRYIVGWSISYSENVIAISDAMRHGIQNNGVPLFYYSDNGGGQKNKTLDAELTGLFPRLGIGHETGIPGNAQGRGIIERAHGTVLMRIARQFATFNGSSADRDWVRSTSIAIDSAVNAANKGRELTSKQQRDLKLLPSWQELIAAVEAGINWYNTEHEHSELPRKASGRHYTPAEYRAEMLHGVELHYLTEVEQREMFRPSFAVPTRRAEIRFLNNIYFAEELAAHHGEELMISVDIHNADSIIVRTMDGKYICDAVWDGNKRAAFPVSMVEDAREKRATRRRVNVERKLEQIEAERTPHRTIEHAPDFSILGTFNVPHQEDEPLFVFPSDREKWLEQQKKKVG